MKKKIIVTSVFTILPILLAFIIFIGLIRGIASITLATSSSETDYGVFMGELILPKEIVEKYKPMIEAECVKQGLDLNYVNVLLAQGMQESGYRVIDIFQASESKYNGVPGLIKTEEESIEQVVKMWIAIKNRIKEMGLVETIPLILQSYNFGMGYLKYVKEHGGEHNINIATEFSEIQLNSDYFRQLFPNATAYGDIYYVPHVLRYIARESFLSETANENINRMLEIAYRYNGVPYELGGDNFIKIDCSGLVMVTLKQMGFDLPHSSESQCHILSKTYDVNFDFSSMKVGDLVFYKDTYESGISHVGFYIGDNKMFDASGKFVSVRPLTDYWVKHFYCSITLFK